MGKDHTMTDITKAMVVGGSVLGGITLLVTQLCKLPPGWSTVLTMAFIVGGMAVGPHVLFWIEDWLDQRQKYYEQEVTSRVQTYDEPAKPSILVHNHWCDRSRVVLEIGTERRTVLAVDLIKATMSLSENTRKLVEEIIDESK
jgi:hypothetical protein